jgi:hypothetical protein
LHFGQRAFQAPSSKNLKSSCGDGRNNTSDVLSLPFARWQRAAARCGRTADKGRLARGEGHLGFHLPLEPDARAIGASGPAPPRRRCNFARRLLEIRLIDRVLPQPKRGTHQFRVRPPYGPSAHPVQTPTQDRGGSCMSRTEWLGEPAIVLGVKIPRARRTL